MGVLSDVFVADREEAEQVDPALGPSGELPTYQAKSLDPVILGQLESAITGLPYEQLSRNLVGVHFESSEGESGVHDVRPALVEALAGLSEERIVSVAARWSEAEEWYGASGPDLEPLVRGLAGLARKAVEADKGLWVWWSL
jgi:hypothetical protein